jgi:hypothetical protein
MRPRALKVEVRGDLTPHLAKFRESMRAYRKTGFEAMGPRERRLYRNWTPEALLAHQDALRPAPWRARAGARPRSRRPRARARRSPGRQQDDPEPEPVAATAEALG